MVIILFKDGRKLCSLRLCLHRQDGGLHAHVLEIEVITLPRETSEKYSEHEEIKSVSASGHVMLSSYSR